jgi:hypothetical protein
MIDRYLQRESPGAGEGAPALSGAHALWAVRAGHSVSARRHQAPPLKWQRLPILEGNDYDQ